MKKEELEKLYRDWDDLKLMEAFKKQHDYTAEALAAMHTVLKERNLAEVAAQEMEKEEERVIQVAQESQQDYETKMLGETISAKAYADKNLVNSEYMHGTIASSRVLWVRFLLFPLIVVSLILVVFSATQESLFDYALEISVIATLILGIIIFRLFKNSKAHYRLYREGNKELFELTQGTYSFKAISPFTYFTCVDKMEFKRGLVTISHPMLYICITNKENETIMLQGNLTALQSPPPAWPHISTVTVPKGARFFNEVVGHRIKVIELKKILDGVHEA